MFRERDSKVFYLVVSSSDGFNWVLPKGHIDPGETPEIAALRELQEEAGIVGEIVEPLSARHFIKTRQDASVQYFLVRELGQAEPIEERTIRWEAESAAFALLSFAEAKAALLEGATMLRKLSSDQ